MKPFQYVIKEGRESALTITLPIMTILSKLIIYRSCYFFVFNQLTHEGP